MAYENLRLGVSPLTKTVFAGRVNKKGDVWVDRKDVTQDFLRCVFDYFEPDTENTKTDVLKQISLNVPKLGSLNILYKSLKNMMNAITDNIIAKAIETANISITSQIIHQIINFFSENVI